jgi:hypothetical protein
MSKKNSHKEYYGTKKIFRKWKEVNMDDNEVLDRIFALKRSAQKLV